MLSTATSTRMYVARYNNVALLHHLLQTLDSGVQVRTPTPCVALRVLCCVAAIRLSCCRRTNIIFQLRPSLACTKSAPPTTTTTTTHTHVHARFAVRTCRVTQVDAWC